MERKRKLRPGFTILDTVLALFVIATMILLAGSFISARDANRRTVYRAQAAALADEEINALRRLGFANLANQTNGSFRNVLYNAGSWNLVSGGITGNALELPANPSITNALSGRLLFPAGSYGAATLQAAWKVVSDSPNGWGIGWFFHARDKDNGYRIRLGAGTTDFDTVTSGTQNLVLESLVNDSATILFSKNVSFTTDAWHTLKIVLDPSGNPTIKIYINNNQQDTGSIIDTTYTSGPAALLGWNGVHAFVDNAQTITSVTEDWDFNASTLPAAWTRLGLNDLPNATPNTFDDNGKLTIETFPNANSTTLKRITVRVEWISTGQTQNYTSTVLIGKSEIGL